MTTVLLPNGPTRLPGARPTREQLYRTLFDRLAAVPGLTTASRDLRPYNKVPSAEQPALFMPHGRETLTAKSRNLPSDRRYEVDVTLYVHASSCPTPTAAETLNALFDALELALAPDRDGACTLGGLVSSCRVSGTIETDEGVLGPQSVAVVPIEIVPFP